MKDITRQSLLALEMDIPQTLARFVNNEALLFKFLKRFLDDKTFEQLKEAMIAHDKEEAFRAAHTLKGVAGNLGLGAIFNAVSPLVEALRAEEEQDIASMFAVVEEKFHLAIEIITSFGDAP